MWAAAPLKKYAVRYQNVVSKIKSNCKNAEWASTVTHYELSISSFKPHWRVRF
jgi:hypothetical protein